jgi:hypothetical protein
MLRLRHSISIFRRQSDRGSRPASLSEGAMALRRVERYDIEQSGRGTVLRMRQRRRASSVAVLSLAVLLVSWWIGPYGPRPALEWGLSDTFYWLWSGFFLLIFALGFLGALYQEDWTIAEEDIVVTKYLGPWRTTHRVPRAHALGIRVEMVTRGETGRIFPYLLHFLDAERKDSGLRIELQLAASVDRFLEALRAGLTLDVEDGK